MGIEYIGLGDRDRYFKDQLIRSKCYHFVNSRVESISFSIFGKLFEFTRFPDHKIDFDSS